METEFEEIAKIDMRKGMLSSQKAMIPSMIYHYGLIDNSLHDKLDIINNKLKMLEAKCKLTVRVKYRRTKVSITEKEISELIMVSDSFDEITNYKKQIRKIHKLIRLSKLRLQVLRDKRDMLIHIGHNERLEKNSKIR